MWLFCELSTTADKLILSAFGETSDGSIHFLEWAQFLNNKITPSRQGEFHPKPLTEPYVTVSHHTALLDDFLFMPMFARHIQTMNINLVLYIENHPHSSCNKLKRLSSEALRSIPITETSSLLRLHPPPTDVSLLLTSRGLRLCRFDFHHQLASTVP
jgi:hypothetical protein